jgi:hypothetical protein
MLEEIANNKTIAPLMGTKVRNLITVLGLTFWEDVFCTLETVDDRRMQVRFKTFVSARTLREEYKYNCIVYCFIMNK